RRDARSSLDAWSSPSLASVMEHLDGLGLGALAIGEKATQLLLGLALGLCLSRRFERLGAALSGEQTGQIGELPCLHCDQLIAGLGCLQDTDGGLARRDERTRLCLCVGQVLHSAGAEGERMLEGGKR